MIGKISPSLSINLTRKFWFLLTLWLTTHILNASKKKTYPTISTALQFGSNLYTYYIYFFNLSPIYSIYVTRSISYHLFTLSQINWYLAWALKLHHVHQLTIRTLRSCLICLLTLLFIRKLYRFEAFCLADLYYLSSMRAAASNQSNELKAFSHVSVIKLLFNYLFFSFTQPFEVKTDLLQSFHIHILNINGKLEICIL